MPSGGWPRRRRPSPFILKYTALAYRCGAREELRKKAEKRQFSPKQTARGAEGPAQGETERLPVVPRRAAALRREGDAAAGGPSQGGASSPGARTIPEARAGETGARRSVLAPARSPGSARRKTRSAGARLQHAPVLSSARRASPGGVAEPAPGQRRDSARLLPFFFFFFFGSAADRSNLHAPLLFFFCVCV